MGWDRFKRYVIVNNGGLFDQSQMTYAVIDDSKSANMQNGFTLLRNGHANLLSVEPFTDWSVWLKPKAAGHQVFSAQAVAERRAA